MIGYARIRCENIKYNIRNADIIPRPFPFVERDLKRENRHCEQ